MSRTRRFDLTKKEARKGPGYEYWSARPGNTNGPPPGRYSKTKTHRLERLASKRVVKEELI